MDTRNTEHKCSNCKFFKDTLTKNRCKLNKWTTIACKDFSSKYIATSNKEKQNDHN